MLGSLISGVIFGGIHCLARNFQFPTQMEQTLWRACSLLSTCIPLLAILLTTHWIRVHNASEEDGPKFDSHGKITGPLMLVVLVLPYLLARLFIMVEIFRTLLYLPPEAYIET